MAGAFTGGIKSRSTSNTNSNNSFKMREMDRLVTVTDYDTNKNYMYAEDDKGKKYEVFVDTEVVQKINAKKNTATDMASINNWQGHSIDENMKKAIPVGSKVVLLRSKPVKNDATRGLSIVQVNRIGGVPDPAPEKCFQGIFTVKSIFEDGGQRISHVQHWAPNGISLTDDDALMSLKEQIDEAASFYQKKMGEFKITKPSLGVQFRALLKTDKEYEYETDPAKKAIYEVVDTSLAFDYIPGPEDEEGKQIRDQAHLLTGDEMLEFAEGYFGYIQEHETFKDQLDNIVIEVCPYYVYPASKNAALAIASGDPEKDKYAHYNPLHQLSHRRSYIDFAQTEVTMGKNAAVNGIILISSDKLQKVNGVPSEIPTNWVSKLHAHNTRGHVHAFVRTSTGNKAEPHENLALLKDDANVNTQTQGYSNSSTTSSKTPTQSAPRETATDFLSESVDTKVATQSTPSASENMFDPFASDLPSETKEEVAATPATPVKKDPPRFSFNKKS